MTKLGKAAVTFGVFAVVSFVTRAVLLDVEIVDLDEASYAVGSWEILRGRRLYVDFADHHPPLTYVYYAVIQALLGHGMMSVRLVTSLLTLPLTAYAASAFYGHDRRGLLAGLLYLVFGASFLGHDMLAVNCELLLLLPASWALVLVRHEDGVLRPARSFGAGFLLGVAVLFKYQAALWLPTLLLGIALAGRGRGRRGALAAVAVLGGFGAVLLTCFVVFLRAGLGPDFLYWNLSHNWAYLLNPVLPGEAWTRGLGRFAPFLLVTAPLWWGWVRSLSLLTPYQRVLVSGLIVFTLPAAFLGLRFYPHYFIQLYIPLALAAAPKAALLATRPLVREARLALSSMAIALVGFTVANRGLYSATRVYVETSPTFTRMADRLQADPCFAGATLFVWGYAPMFYYYSRLPPASRFIFPEATLTGYVPGNTGSVRGEVDTTDRIRASHWDWLMDDLARNRATYVLDTAPARLHRWNHYPLSGYPRLARLVLAQYEDRGDVEGVRIYRRRGCGATQTP